MKNELKKIKNKFNEKFIQLVEKYGDAYLETQMKSKYFDTPEEVIYHIYYNCKDHNSASRTSTEIDKIIKDLRRVSAEMFRNSREFPDLVENFEEIEKLSSKYFRERLEEFSREEEEKRIKRERKEELDRLDEVLDSL